MIVGLTGGTGTGKTSISQFFSDAGFSVINFDLVARQIYNKDSDCYNEVINAFGDSIIDPDGEINRKKLGAVVFSDKSRLELLNKIVYKYILALTSEQIENSQNKLLLLDAPTLFEAGLDKKCDIIVGVTAKKELREERICKRDKIDCEAAKKRIESQKSDEFYKNNCHYIIDNSYSIKNLEDETRRVIGEILLNNK